MFKMYDKAILKGPVGELHGKTVMIVGIKESEDNTPYGRGGYVSYQIRYPATHIGSNSHYWYPDHWFAEIKK